MTIHLVCGDDQEPRAWQTTLDQTEWAGPPVDRIGPMIDGRPAGKWKPITQDFSGDVVVVATDTREGFEGDTFIFENPAAARRWVTALADQIDTLLTDE